MRCSAMALGTCACACACVCVCVFVHSTCRRVWERACVYKWEGAEEAYTFLLMPEGNFKCITSYLKFSCTVKKILWLIIELTYTILLMFCCNGLSINDVTLVTMGILN